MTNWLAKENKPGARGPTASTNSRRHSLRGTHLARSPRNLNSSPSPGTNPSLYPSLRTNPSSYPSLRTKTSLYTGPGTIPNLHPSFDSRIPIWRPNSPTRPHIVSRSTLDCISSRLKLYLSVPLYPERSQHVNLKSYRELSLMTAPDCSSSDDKPLLQETIQPKVQPQSNVKRYDSGRNPFTDAFRVSVMSDTGENSKVFDASNAFDPPSKAAPLCQPHVVANTEMQRNKSCKVEVMHERKMRREEPIPPMPSTSRVATSTSTTRRGPPPEQHKKRAQPPDKSYTVEYYRFAPSSFGSRNYEVQRVATPEPKQRPLPVPPNSAQNSQAEYASSSRTGKQRQATRPLPAVPTDPTIYLRNLPIPPRNVSRTAVQILR